MCIRDSYAPEAMTLVYLVTNEYDGTDELGFRWDDADAGISWPMENPIVSERDAASPGLRAALAGLSHL